MIDFKIKAVKEIYGGNFIIRGDKVTLKNGNVINLDNDEILQKAKELEEEYKKQQAIEKIKTEGLDYTLNGKTYKISLTNKDAMGMLQVAKAFELGIEETVIWFSNGTKGVIKKEEFENLAKWFAEKRNLLFTNPDELLKEKDNQ